jgi:dinuclear metal center YbgI/SA1388 family protein
MEMNETSTFVATRQEILDYCNARLEVGSYQDVAINGLQVEGSPEIQRIAVAVSTSEKTISAAVDWGADALLVHHGLFWGGSVQPLVGLFGHRLKRLFQHDINLIAYHLPLDGHTEIGNNALLAQQLDVQVTDRFGSVAGMPLGVVGSVPGSITLTALLKRLSTVLDREPVAVGAIETVQRLSRIAILSGSGYGTLAEAAALGCQAMITGDLREPTMAEARELGVIAIAAGHEATERSGVQALALELNEKFNVETMYFPDPNPI